MYCILPSSSQWISLIHYVSNGIIPLQLQACSDVDENLQEHMHLKKSDKLGTEACCALRLNVNMAVALNIMACCRSKG